MFTMKKYPLLAIVLAIASGCTRTGKVYEETWQSLSGHAPAPEWYADAKFGIYFHWGVIPYRNLQRYNDPVKYEKEMAIPDPNRRFDKSHYPFYENTPPRTEDPELRYLYGNIPEAKWKRRA